MMEGSEHAATRIYTALFRGGRAITQPFRWLIHSPRVSPLLLPLQFSTILLMVFGGEVLADWIKHGFIIKFNQLTPSIYDEYSTILARFGGDIPASV